MMRRDQGKVIPGAPGRARCPACGSAVPFRMSGGPHPLTCAVCRAPFQVDVVYDGNRWVIRRRVKGAIRRP
jgi:hypothetical protein